MAAQEAPERMESVSATAGGLVLDEALQLLRVAPHAVAVLDAEGRLGWANDACARLLAWGAAGDALLKAVSERLSESVREGDTVARLAGDEFTLLLPGIHYAEDLAAISQKLVETLRRPFPIDGQPVRVTASGGISLYPEDGEEAETLVRNADTAMYRARRSCAGGAPSSAFWSRRTSSPRGLHRRDALRGPVGAGDGLPAGARVATARLARAARDGQPLRPRAAAGGARRARREGARRERPRAGRAAPGGARGLRHAGPRPRRGDAAGAALGGVYLSIDGFGAGFSSLAHLRRLPVDALKIDLSFVRGATTDPDDASNVTAVIAVAHSLGLRVVALGVETEAQVALLRSLGCDEVQGYLWSPPVPPERCEGILAEGALPAPSFPPRGRRGAVRPGPLAPPPERG